MRILSSTELRANLASVMDRVTEDHAPVIVHRARGKPVVMVSLEDWEAMDETTYLLSSPANRDELRAALAEAEAGQAVVTTMGELEAMAGE
ncbi:MAG: type II toxin-antitoxin system Phd/YefM family antitoxin [Gemmobacter sp.]